MQVGNDGTVNFRNRERISFDYILSRKFAGDLVQVSLMRKGERMTVEVEARVRMSLPAVYVCLSR